MSVVVSVLTPEWALHVSDATPATRTLLLREPGRASLWSWSGPLAALDGLIPELAARVDRDPGDLARATAAVCTGAVAAEASAIHVGWGADPKEGREGSFRFLVTNFEHEDEDDEGFRVYGGFVSERDPRKKGAKAPVSFSIQVSTTVELPRDAVRAIERIPRDIQRRRPVVDLALACTEVVTVAEPGAAALIALLHRDGTLEGGVLANGSLAPIAAPTTPGAHRL